MKHPFRFCLVALLVAAACGQASEETPDAAPDAPAASPAEEPAGTSQQYEAVGVVVSFMAEKQFVNVKHETIPGFMNAMTMPFEVKDTTLLRGIQVGDSITFRFTAADGIQAIEKRE